MRFDVVVVGSVNVDLVLEVTRHPHPGETLLGTSGRLYAGGKGANQAVAAARRGARTAMVGAVGQDANATTALAELVAAGADVRAVRTAPGPTGLAVVTLAADGENTIIVVPGANAEVSPAAVDAAADVIGAGTVCVLQAEIPLASVQRAAEIAAARGSRLVLNVAPAATLSLETLQLADPLVVNEHEAALLLAGLPRTASTLTVRPADGRPASAVAEPGTLDDAVPAEVVDALATAGVLRSLGVPSVVITLGRAGAVGAEAAGTWHVPARPVAARDTTGAGDAFVGALAAGLAQGTTLRDSAVAATRVAAYSVQRLGAQASYPWKDDPLP